MVVLESLTSFQISVDWFDSCSDAQLLVAILRWCETNQGKYFREGCPPSIVSTQARAELSALWSGTIVVRSNTVQILVDSHAALGQETTRADITPWLSRVGRTSWVMNFYISYGPDAAPLARVSSVYVNVDPDTLQASTPIPRGLLGPMQALAAASSEAAVRLGLALPAEPELVPADAGKRGPPDGAYTWCTTVRATDCDSLGHLNNSKYALLAAEARAVAALDAQFSHQHPPALAGCAAAAAPRTFVCDYRGQPKPFEEVRIKVWSEAGVLCFELRGGADITLATMVMDVGPLPAAGPASDWST